MSLFTLQAFKGFQYTYEQVSFLSFLKIEPIRTEGLDILLNLDFDKLPENDKIKTG